MSDQSANPVTVPPTTTVETPKEPLENKLYTAGDEKKPDEKPADPPKVEEPKKEEPPKAEALKPIVAADLKLPEGLTLDPKTSESLLTVLNDGALTKGELASKLIEMQVAREKTAGEEQAKLFTDLQTKWEDECKKDATYGGAKFDDTVSSIGKLMTQYGSPEVREVFNVTGAGNNPVIFRFMAKLSAALTEPGARGDATPSNQQRPLEERLYANTGKK